MFPSAGGIHWVGTVVCLASGSRTLDSMASPTEPPYRDAASRRRRATRWSHSIDSMLPIELRGATVLSSSDPAILPDGRPPQNPAWVIHRYLGWEYTRNIDPGAIAVMRHVSKCSLPCHSWTRPTLRLRRQSVARGVRADPPRDSPSPSGARFRQKRGHRRPLVFGSHPNHTNSPPSENRTSCCRIGRSAVRRSRFCGSRPAWCSWSPSSCGSGPSRTSGSTKHSPLTSPSSPSTRSRLTSVEMVHHRCSTSCFISGWAGSGHPTRRCDLYQDSSCHHPARGVVGRSAAAAARRLGERCRS